MTYQQPIESDLVCKSCGNAHGNYQIGLTISAFLRQAIEWHNCSRCKTTLILKRDVLPNDQEWKLEKAALPA